MWKGRRSRRTRRAGGAGGPGGVGGQEVQEALREWDKESAESSWRDSWWSHSSSNNSHTSSQEHTHGCDTHIWGTRARPQLHTKRLIERWGKSSFVELWALKADLIFCFSRGPFCCIWFMSCNHRWPHSDKCTSCLILTKLSNILTD